MMNIDRVNEAEYENKRLYFLFFFNFKYFGGKKNVICKKVDFFLLARNIFYQLFS